MTVVVDEKGCLPLPLAAPGDEFDMQIAGEMIVLMPLKPTPPANVKFEKVDGYTVAATDRPINQAALEILLKQL